MLHHIKEAPSLCLSTFKGCQEPSVEESGEYLVSSPKYFPSTFHLGPLSGSDDGQLNERFPKRMQNDDSLLIISSTIIIWNSSVEKNFA